MPPLVLQLQQQALNPEVKVSDLLRMAVVVAAKLDIKDFGSWARRELDGYEGQGKPPSYRSVKGVLKAHNPYHGWIPVVLEDHEIQRKLECRDAGSPIGELEDLYHSDGKGDTLQMPLPHEWLMKVFGRSREFQLGIVPTLLIGRASIKGILDAVRNEVLQWSLTLERRGILGEGMAFSADEKSRAAQVNYHIGSFAGVLGNVTDSNVLVGDYASIHNRLKESGISPEGRNELDAILDELRTAAPENKPGIVTRGMNWLAKYGPAIGTLSETVRHWLQPSGGV